MKRRISTVLCFCLISLCGLNTSHASNYAAAVVDVAVVRPAGFAATVVGSVFFVVALPFAAAANGVKETADTLVVVPAQFTFERSIGDFDTPNDNSKDLSNSEFKRESGNRQARNSELKSDKACGTKATHIRKPRLVVGTLSAPMDKFIGAPV